ncbi:hypothetical protein AXK58_21510 [Tsukamurella tyrosinosolvens]|nr:hypothetical protein AXK58_21510 [Tsukamurella tyrosinosolvens]
MAQVADVRLDLGFDLEAAADPETVLWCPGGWAAAAVVRYPRLRLASAGPDWLGRRRTSNLGRRVWARTAAELAVGADAGGSPVFAKLPETKHDRFPAEVRAADQLAHDASLLPVDEPIQMQTPVVFSHEVRCWVLDGRVVAHSEYFPDAPREHWPSLEDATRADQAVSWLQSVLPEEQPAPPAFVVDVGLSPGPGGARWLILEANAAWSSDWYNAADLPAVLETMARSQRDVPAEWRWRPSPLLNRQAAGLLRR